MWKRLQLAHRPKEQIIGDPVLVTSTFDEKSLQQLPNVAHIHHGRCVSAKPTFVTSDNSDALLRELPPLPSAESHEMLIQWPSNVESTATASPLTPVSERIGNSPQFALPYLGQNSREEPGSTSSFSLSSPSQISPPQTPVRNFSRRSPYLGDESSISPGSPSNWSSPSSSPAIDRSSRRSTFPSGSNRFDQELFTGNESAPLDISQEIIEPRPRYSLDQVEMKEPGSSSRAPSSQAIEAVQKWMRARSKLKDVTEPSKYTIERPNAVTSRGGPAVRDGHPAARRAASASAALQNSLPATKPLTISPRNMRRPSPPLSAISETSTITLSANKAKSEPSFELPDEVEDQIKPTVPLKVGRNSPPRIYTSINRHGPRVTSPSSPEEDFSTTSSPLSNNISWDKPLPNLINERPGELSLKSPVPTDQHNFKSAMQEINFQPHLVSRFSATTYASTAASQSLPSSPILPSFTGQWNPQTQSSIMDRSRPLPSSAITNARATTRKPAPSRVPGALGETINVNKQRRNSKSLPQSPPEKESVDRITRLQAQLDTLRYRRENIQKIVRDWTISVPAGTIAASRDEMRVMVDRLKAEMAEIGLEEHELGIKLHRAWKRKDESEPAEPTSLWIRRVTS
ncbi:hypothetical protein L228DRAFT_241535 [Xylona heveae TC161]|uniref:Uncharacterized protein n=1 Tax=Xylona heveae (strain CBS 132557 / TC161) TaxID=1328760 RepID=A0A165A0K8_XYLHT|nr:hypothetical protein L228DRAFT_241535 [Xylona heveae TC161]KZF19783.1 hypothetical protein L228DRAFT_241535 [Xylona heveae TC161]